MLEVCPGRAPQPFDWQGQSGARDRLARGSLGG